MGNESPANNFISGEGGTSDNAANKPNAEIDPTSDPSPSVQEKGTPTSESLANTISEVDDVRNMYLKFDCDEKFKPTFQQAVQVVLGKIRNVLEGLLELNPKDLSPSLKSFNTTLASLKDIVKKVEKAKKKERYQCYASNIGDEREYLVETLVGKMAEDVCRIAQGHSAEKELEEEVAELKAKSQELKSMSPSVSSVKPGEAAGHHFENNGSGTQYNAADRARQFNGTTFSGGTQTWN